MKGCTWYGCTHRLAYDCFHYKLCHKPAIIMFLNHNARGWCPIAGAGDRSLDLSHAKQVSQPPTTLWQRACKFQKFASHGPFMRAWHDIKLGSMHASQLRIDKYFLALEGVRVMTTLLLCFPHWFKINHSIIPFRIHLIHLTSNLTVLFSVNFNLNRDICGQLVNAPRGHRKTRCRLRLHHHYR